MGRAQEREPMLGTIDGDVFTNDHIYGTHPSDRAAMRIQWAGGHAWRLSLLAEGQNALALPGTPELFRRAPQGRPFDERRLILVIAGRSSGLSSLNNWIVQEEAGFRAICIDLEDVRRSGRDATEQLEAAAEAIRHEVRYYAPGLDEETRTSIQEDLAKELTPVGVLEKLARSWHEQIQGVVFRNFETLDEDTRKGLFGRLRRLLDHPARPLRTLRIFLLGHSLSALDPRLTDPPSNLLNVSRIYTVTALWPEEIGAMAAHGLRHGRLKKADEAQLWNYTGGHPLLVQALLGTMEDQETDLQSAAEDLLHQSLPAFEAWKQGLRDLLGKHGVGLERIARILLRSGRYSLESIHDPFAFQELFIQGWIRPFEPGLDTHLLKDDIEANAWVWRSRCHQHLAEEAFARRSTR